MNFGRLMDYECVWIEVDLWGFLEGDVCCDDIIW